MHDTRTQVKALEVMPSAVPLEVDGRAVPAYHLVVTESLVVDLLEYLGQKLDQRPRCEASNLYRPALGTLRDTLSAARIGQRLARGVVQP